MDDSQILLQVLNNVIQRNTKRVQDYEIEIANYMTTLIKLENRVASLEEINQKYLEALDNFEKAEENKK